MHEQKPSREIATGDAPGFLREVLTSIHGPKATRARLRQVAWVRFVAFLPFIWIPTLIAFISVDQAARDPKAFAALEVCWIWLFGLWLVSNTTILFSNGRLPRLERTLTFVCLFAEIGSNHIVVHSIGSLSTVAVINIIAVAVGYRVFVDYGTGAFAVAVGLGLFVATAILELAGVLTVAPAIQGTALPAAYIQTSTAWNTVVATSATILIVFLAVNYGVNQTLKLHRYITESVLKRYLPAPLVERASKGELTLDAPPERRVITVMFTDLVGFTSLSEHIGPEAIGSLLNTYLAEMCTIAHSYEATIDKFIGDCIMIVFGAPEPLEEAEQARRCVALAVELQKAVPRLEGATLQARTGINTGEAVIGNFGSLVRSDYTVLGPTVNLAARLETASKPGRILMGPQTARLLGGSGIEVESAGMLTLKGISEPVEAFFVRSEAASGEVLESLAG
ncbi:MAG: adenylate/guanylate cyclase domain-containing protein [Myxococcota bacterium]